MEQLTYNLLFRSFVRLGIDNDRVLVPHQGDIGRNSNRPLTTDISRKVIACDPVAPGGQAAAVDTLFGRRDAGQGLGFYEELPADGQHRRHHTTTSRRAPRYRPRRPSQIAARPSRLRNT